MNKSAAISGLHIRLDVPTKCRIVERVLSTTFDTREQQNKFINRLAEQSFVNPVTIKLWCGKYQNTWKLGKDLPVGTMSFSFTTVPEIKLPSIVRALNDLRKQLNKVVLKSQTKCYENSKFADTQSTKTPGAILDDLILNKKAK
jgi:hypothetical protein